MRSHVASLVLAICITFVYASNPIRESLPFINLKESTVYRLPTSTVPTHYDVQFMTRLPEVFSFIGRVIIGVNIVTTTNVIVLNVAQLNVTSATVFSVANNITVSYLDGSYDAIREFYLLTFTNNLPTGSYQIILGYDGEIRDDMAGLYRSYYDINGERRWIATTQFQPTYARMVFPCFDEPAYKATFKIRIGHFENVTAQSNMPVVGISEPDDNAGGRVWTEFETTPIMPTYLVAFVISDFESTENANGTFNIWSRPGTNSSKRYAQIYGEQIYDAIGNYLGVIDPVPQIDQVAIPDFSAGAMENWGLITYREQYLLWEEFVSNSRHMQNVGTIMAHELGHIWFGNLVTLEWWDDLWFNEGFATYFEFFGASLVHPEWRLMELFVVEILHPALVTDSLESTRPMVNVVSSPSSILSNFDIIAYNKAGSVLRMLQHFIGEESFKQGLQTFLTEYAHKNLITSELWRHFQTASESSTIFQSYISVEEIMTTWVTQSGYPLITVTRNYSTSVTFIEQERFFLNRNSPTADPQVERWWIPLNYAIQDQIEDFELTYAFDWIPPHTGLSIVVPPTGWIILNNHQTSFYRVNYDDTNWQYVTDYLKLQHTNIPPINRASLIDDSLNLARAGYVNYSIPLNLMEYLTQETDYVPWQAVFAGYTFLNRILASHEHYHYFQWYVRQTIEELIDSLSFSEGAADSHLTRILRGQVWNWACRSGLQTCYDNSARIFHSWLDNPDQETELVPDMKSVVYCYGIRQASEDDWTKVWNRFLETDVATEESLLLNALGCTLDKNLINRYLQLSITDNSGIRAQDTLTVFQAVLNGDPENVDAVLEFVIDNHEEISAFYESVSVVGSILNSIATRVTTEVQVEKLSQFVASYDLGASASVAQSAILTANENLVWIADYSPSFMAWLTVNVEVPISDTAGASSLMISFGMLLIIQVLSIFV